MIKKIFISICCLTLVFALISCNKTTVMPTDNPKPQETLAPLETVPDETDEPKRTEYKDGIIGEREITNYDDVDVCEGDVSPEYSKGERDSTAAPSATVDGFISENGYQIRAGMLTAGEIKDNKDLANWRSLFDKENGKNWDSFVDNRELYSKEVVKVKVLSDNGPVANVKVLCKSTDGEIIWSSVSDINGDVCLFFHNYDSFVINIPDADINQNVTADQVKETIEINVENSNLFVKELDLMLMIDTTGSMGDELEFLKEELSDMVDRVSKSDEAFSIRVSVNFYRDEGDEYVVKYFDFRDDVNECINQISEQRASGGGDYPEAVHKALANIVEDHDWRENAVKLCFLVLDAPPHIESEVQGVNSSIVKSIKKISELGIRIIPVASSGIDEETTYILRSFAMMTNGTYVFLTNDSGIGYSHLEPDDTEFTVEPLNECMIRIVSEYCGIQYEPVYTYEPTDPIVDPQIPEPIYDDVKG